MQLEGSFQSSLTENNNSGSIGQQTVAPSSSAAEIETLAAATTTETVTNTSAITTFAASVSTAPQYVAAGPAAVPVTVFESATVTSQYSQPPPSYQDALSYPTSSYQSIRMGTTFPKPDMGPMPPYSILPSVTQQPLTAAPANPPVIVTVSGVPVENCPFCHVGSIITEFDLCLLVCLILLAIFTFPVGLLFLCCIPCTIHKRCNSCQRTVRMLEVSNLVQVH